MRVVTKVCRVCNKKFIIPLSEEEESKLFIFPAQEVLPWLEPNIRELFITGMCGECFDNMIGHEDDN